MNARPCTHDDDHEPGDQVLALLRVAALSMGATLTFITLLFAATGMPGETLALGAIAAAVLAVAARPHPRPASDVPPARDGQHGGSTRPAPERTADGFRRSGGPGQRWTPAEDRKLARLVTNGRTSRQIAAELGRTPAAVRTRRRVLRNQPARRKRVAGGAP